MHPPIKTTQEDITGGDAVSDEGRFLVGPPSAPDRYIVVRCLGGGGEGEVWSGLLPLSPTGVPVAHGDVKPGNIVVPDDGLAVLVDLGLMRIFDGTVIAGGTVPYAAPELFRDGAPSTPATDRFAFIATVTHAILGDTPPV